MEVNVIRVMHTLFNHRKVLCKKTMYIVCVISLIYAILRLSLRSFSILKVDFTLGHCL